MLTILITNSKGGCGKTTIATNLASAFAVGGFNTALAEADPQRSCLAWLDRRPDTAARIRGLDWVDLRRGGAQENGAVGDRFRRFPGHQIGKGTWCVGPM